MPAASISDPAVLSSILYILLAGGALQFTVSMQILLFGMGFRSIFLGFCSFIAAIYIGAHHLELAGEKFVTSDTALSIPMVVNTDSAGTNALLEKRVEPRVQQVLGPRLEASQFRLPIIVIASDLAKGMTAGILLLIPFLIIDLVVQHIFKLLEFEGLSVSVVSLPLKILLFLSVDGWTILFDRFLT